MKKKLLAFLCLLSVSLLLSAKQIDANLAQRVATTFLTDGSSLRSGSDISLSLVYTEKETTSLRSGGASDDAYYHVFNIGNGNGFIIISADDVNVPVIGYSDTGSYDPNNLPENFKVWMKTVQMGTKAAIEKGQQPSDQIQQRWTDYLAGKVPVTTRASTSVTPLIKTKWGQSDPFNNDIPFWRDYGYGSRILPPTGCVATAMAQIMKYYNYPKSGLKPTKAYLTGVNGFSIPSIDLTKTIYDWDNMLNEYKGTETDIQKNAVSQLMYHVGASLEMDYATDNGSGAVVNHISLRDYFGYDPDIYTETRTSNKTDWVNLLKNELSARRPIFYSGDSPSGGHAFVCDGYDQNGLFHFNFGWEGYADGYYDIDAPYDYTGYHRAVVNIKPKIQNITRRHNFKFLTGLTLPLSVNLRQGDEYIPVNINITNSGADSFIGYYTAVLTDQNDNIKYILDSREKDFLQRIPTNYASAYPYTNIRIPSNATSGSYRLKVAYKEDGSNTWKLLNNGATPYYVNVTVSRPPYVLNLNSGLTISTNNIKPGASFNTNVNIKNTGISNFQGYYAVALTRTDWCFDCIEQIVTESLGNTLTTIAPNATQSGVRSCVVPANLAPGVYRVRVVTKPKDEKYWKILDLGANPNFAEITIEPPYNMTLGGGLSVTGLSTSAAKAGSAFSTKVNIKNTGTAKFEGYYSVVLTDAANNVKYVLTEEQANTVLAINPNASINSIKDCLIPANTVPGTYRLMLAYKQKKATIWKVLNTGATPSYVSVSVPKPLYDIRFDKGFSVYNLNTTAAKRGDDFSVTMDIKNYGTGAFKGYYTSALTDENDNVKYILNNIMANDLVTFAPGYKPWSGKSVAIPLNTAPGVYRIKLVYKEQGTSAWKVLNQGVSPYYTQVTVTPQFAKNDIRLWEPVTVRDFNTSAIKAGDKFYTRLSYRNYESGAFYGYFSPVLTDNYNNVKYVLDQHWGMNQVNSIGGYGGMSTYVLCTVPINIPSGSYRLSIAIREKGSSIWRVLNTGASPYYLNVYVTSTRNATSIESDQADGLSVYPNPVSDVLNINAGTTVTKVVIVDLSGKVVLTDNHPESTKSISVSHLPQGMYMVKVETENAVTTQKIYKK